MPEASATGLKVNAAFGRIKGEALRRKLNADEVDDVNQTDRRFKGDTNVAVTVILQHPMIN